MNPRLTEKWLATQNRVLDQFSADLPLSAVLDSLIDGAERQLPGARCLATMVSEAGQALRVVAAPQLPELLRGQGARLPVTEGDSPCGAAACLREPMIVRDVQADARWASYRPAAEALHIRGCWSTPLVGASGHVLGTFAVVLDRPCEPTNEQRQIIDTCTHLAAMLIQRHRHDAVLRESEQRFRAMADAAPVLIWMAGLDKACTYFNEPWLAFTGRTLEQELGTGWAEGVHADDRARCFDRYRHAFEQREPFKVEYRLRRHDGAYRWILDHGVPRHASDGRFLGFIGSCIDITDRRQTEQELRDSERTLRFTLEATRIGTWRWDIASGTVQWSENLARIHGQDPASLTGRFEDFVGHIAPAHRDRVLTELRQAVEQGTAYDTEYRTQLGPGKPSWMAARGQVIYGSDSRPQGMAGVCMDVTDRREAEERTRIHARQQATVAELGQRALVGENLQALMEEIVRRVAETLDVPLAKVLECEQGGKALRLRAGVGWREGLVGQATVGSELASQAGYTLQADRPVVVKDLPSEQRFNGPSLLHEHGVISGMSVIIPGAAGRPWGVFGVHTRVSRAFTRDDVNFLQSVAHLLAAALQRNSHERQLKALNETLEQRVADRTAVAEHRATQLRVLAGQLAQAERRERRRLAQLLHDNLQQLLVAAKLRVDALTKRLADEALANDADQVDQLLEQAIDTSRSLTVELSPPILYDAGLPAAIEWLCRWMNDKHELTVELDMDVAGEQAPLTSDVCVFLFDAVREMLFNIVKHADVQQARVRLTQKPDEPVCILVTDEGAGFDAATAQDESVTIAGLGLFSIQQRVELFGGRLDVQSKPGAGTRISIELDRAAAGTAPRAVADRATAEDAELTEDAVPALDVDPAPASLPSADAAMDAEAAAAVAPPIRVLVVDDHTPLREGLIALLVGQRDIEVVGEAVDGEMALEAAHRLRPDVVLMDVHMPGLNGIEATRQLAQRMPNVHIVGLSIEEHQEMAHIMHDAGAAAYLPKGSPPSTLFAAIRAGAPAIDRT